MAMRCVSCTDDETYHRMRVSIMLDEYKGAISTYVHTYFEDIEPVYRKRVYLLK